MPTEQRFRGRPISFPRDTSPMSGLTTATEPRLAWLLLRHRLHSGDPALLQRKQFAERLGGLGVNADPSRVSRWESGSHKIPARVLYGYGALLGYPDGHLTSIAHYLRSSLEPHADPGHLLIQNIPDTHPELDELFNQIDTSAPTGHTWTRLAASIMADTYMYLPEKMWTELTEQLLSESSRSVRIAHIRRQAASGVITRNPASQRVMVRSIGRMVTAPGSRFVVPTLMLLRDVVNPEVNSLLLQMMQSPPGQLRRGTTAAIAGKIVRDDFGADDLDRLEAILPALFPTKIARQFPTDLIDVLSAMEESRQERVLKQVNDASGVPVLRESLQSGLTVATDRSYRLATAIARRTTALMDTTGGPIEADQLLVRLIEEALFHVHRERRHQAALLLGVSPFADVLPTAIMQSLDTNDRYSVSRCLSTIAFLKPRPDIAVQLLQWVLNGPSNWLRCRAMTALVPLGPHLGEAAQTEIAAMIARSDDPEVLHTGLNLLGMMGASATNQLMDGEDEVPNAAVTWRESGALIEEDPEPVR